MMKRYPSALELRDPIYRDRDGLYQDELRRSEWVRRALTRICGVNPPAGLEGDALQDWAVDNVPDLWMTGIGAIEAAEHMADTAIENGNLQRLRPQGPADAVMRLLWSYGAQATSDLAAALKLEGKDTRRLLDRMERAGLVQSYRVEYQRDKAWRDPRRGV